MNPDIYISKAFASGLSAEAIGAKLGMSPDEVRSRFNALVKEAEKANVNGYVSLMESFNILANQYQLLGMSLHMIQTALANTASHNEINSVIFHPEGSVDQTTALLENFIVLKRFEPPSINPEEAELKQSIGGG